MAYISLVSATQTSLKFCVRQLENPSSGYDYWFSTNPSSHPAVYPNTTLYYDENNPGYYKSQTWEMTGLSCGTSYTIYGGANWNGTWYDLTQKDTATAACAVPTYNRPSNFAWANSKTSGGNFNLTWAEWNDFLWLINQMRLYKRLPEYYGYGPYSYSGRDAFTKGYAGGDFMAYQYNQAVKAIADMGPGIGLFYVNPGDSITAKMLNDLVIAYNSIS